MENFILVGSAAFFGDMEGFSPKDRDYVLLVDEPSGFSYVRQTHSSYCLFEWRRMTPQGFVDYALLNGPAMQLGKFLVPEFAEAIGLTMDDLRKLRPLAESLDAKHGYERVIYDSYMANGRMELTAEQLSSAYGEYRKEREGLA